MLGKILMTSFCLFTLIGGMVQANGPASGSCPVCNDRLARAAPNGIKMLQDGNGSTTV